MYAEHPPSPGQCLDTGHAAVVACTEPHDAEVINVGKLTATSMPDETTASTMTMPVCRDHMTDYLGGPDADSTNLVAMPLWPNDEEWRQGQRWLLCTVAEVGMDEKPLTRTGSLEGALRGGDQLRFQTCSVSSPSRDARLQRGRCDAPHLGEALPGVIRLGDSAGPMPSSDAVTKLAQQRCPVILRRYLGGQTQEVLPAWRVPNAESWSRGYTNIVCYAEAIRPVSVRLRNLGPLKLPS
ncbi:putative regulator of septum formation [Actinocrispum wychmicini]|uniref:Putative regulator of septum formation n=2 Tax=Actinocrispum wychmicini TaxID=1213861 RepID=A0A4R2JW93_9PSEU|nr:putative regulator of septum formation [Actinocrispum wychmicini]